MTAALVLLLPLVAMLFTDEVAWDKADFAVIGAMLFGACGAHELAARMTGSIACRAAVGVAVVAAFVLIWMNLAVGIIGSEDNPANLMYGGVLAMGLLGALGVRFRPHGMARALAATAFAQASVGLIAPAAGLGATGANWPGAIVVLTGVFVALWLVSAWLVRSGGGAICRGRSAVGSTRKVHVMPLPPVVWPQQLSRRVLPEADGSARRAVRLTRRTGRFKWSPGNRANGSRW